VNPKDPLSPADKHVDQVFCRHLEPCQVIGFAILVGVLLLSAWVFADARRLGAKRGALGGGLLDAGAVEWLIGCLFLFGIVFPCYFLARRKLVRARESRDTPSYPVQSTYNPDPDPDPDAPWPMLPAYARPAGVTSQPGWQPYVPMKQRRSGRTWQVVCAVLAGAVVFGLVGFRVYVTFHKTSQPNALPLVTSAPPAPVVTAHGIAGVLEHDALRTADFPAGYTVQLVSKGDQVRGQTTLVNCGYHFTTERHRVARRGYAVHQPGGQYRGINNELVAYDKASQAALALRQWHKATERCAHHALPMKRGNHGALKAKERALGTVLHDGALPINQNMLTLESLKQHSRTLFLTAMLQRRGRILDCLFVFNTQRPDATEIDAELRLAAVTGNRLHGQA
jgi:hypothetical protein